MKENYIVPMMTVFTVSPSRALMLSGGVPDYNPIDLSWDDTDL